MIILQILWLTTLFITQLHFMMMLHESFSPTQNFETNGNRRVIKWTTINEYLPCLNYFTFLNVHTEVLEKFIISKLEWVYVWIINPYNTKNSIEKNYSFFSFFNYWVQEYFENILKAKRMTHWLASTTYMKNFFHLEHSVTHATSRKSILFDSSI